MPMLSRARSVLAAVRGALAPEGVRAAAAPTGSVAEMIRALTRAARPAPVEPAFEAQRLTKAYVEPSVRTYTTWTPADLKAAMVLADGGNLQRAADLCDAILGDDRAPAVLNTRVNAVLGSELTFEPGRGRSKKKAAKALEVGEDWYIAFEEAVLGQMLLWGRLLGVVPAQEEWREFIDHAGRVIPVVENWHPRHLRQDTRDKSWWIKTGDSLTEVKIAPGDGKWVVFTPYGTNRPWAHGLWRGMARLWLLKQYALDDWGRHSEVHGQGIKVGIPPAQGDAKHGRKELRQELANDLAELASDGVVVLPPGFDFKLVEASANTWEMFRAQIDMANAAMSIMAIGSNLPTEVGNGAQTGATAQNLVRIDYKRADAEVLSTMAHDQVLTWWAEFNFGDRGLAPWPLWDVQPKADQKARAELIKTVMDALDKGGDAGVPLDVPGILEEFEIPQRTVGEDEARGSGKIFKYHLDYGVLTTNELRRSLGFDPIPGGDAAPEPIAKDLPGRDVGQDALSAIRANRQRVSALGSPSQPRDRDGKWTDGHGTSGASHATSSEAGHGGGGGAASESGAAVDSDGRTGWQAQQQQAERDNAVRHERRAAEHRKEHAQAETAAARAEGKARAAREKADALERELKEKQVAVDKAQEALDDPEDDADEAALERRLSDAEKDFDRADARHGKALGIAEEREGIAEELRDEAGSAQDRVEAAELKRDLASAHAEMLGQPREKYRSSVEGQVEEAQAGWARANQARLDAEARKADAARTTEELRRAKHDWAKNDRYGPDESVEEADRRATKTLRQYDAQIAAAERVESERAQAAREAERAANKAKRTSEYWEAAAREARSAIDKPIDGDGDGLLNEEERSARDEELDANEDDDAYLSATRGRLQYIVAKLGAPDQPRDKEGKWTDGHGGGGASDGVVSAGSDGHGGGGHASGGDSSKSSNESDDVEDVSDSEGYGENADADDMQAAADKEHARAEKLEQRAKKREERAAVAREKADKAQAEVVERERAEHEARNAVDAAEQRVSEHETALEHAEDELQSAKDELADVENDAESDLDMGDDDGVEPDAIIGAAGDDDGPSIGELQHNVDTAKRDLDESRKQLKTAEQDAEKAEKAREKAEERADRLEEAALDAEEKAADARDEHDVAKTTADLYAADANMLRGTADEYAAAASAKAAESHADLKRAEAAFNEARRARQEATREANGASPSNLPAADYYDETRRAEAEAQHQQARKRESDLAIAEAREERRMELARIRADYWSDAAKQGAIDGDGDGILNEEDEQKREAGPIDGDGDGRVNEDAGRLSTLTARPHATVLSTLSRLALRHNRANRGRGQRTRAAVLRAVWDRGAALAPAAEREAWAMGRVRAFLHLLETGEPEHPAYTADDDLLPMGHERRPRG